jgi:cytochrome b561
MVPNGTPDGSSHSSRFDTTLARRYVLAIVCTLVAIPLIGSVIGAPIGIPLFLLGIRPLKEYFAEKAIQSVKEQEEPWQRGELNL